MSDLIACLYPFREVGPRYAHRAISSPHNRARVLFIKDDSELAGVLPFGVSLQLAFSNGPKFGSGFVLGTDPNSCDIVLPPLPTVSRRHCYLTFDAERRLILRDCSTNGTIVEFDGRGGERRRHFTWILSGHEVPDATKRIVIEIDAYLKFEVVIPKPSSRIEYSENVDKFLEEIAVSRPLNGNQSTASTAVPVRTQGTLANGASSVVSNGSEYASGGV